MIKITQSDIEVKNHIRAIFEPSAMSMQETEAGTSVFFTIKKEAYTIFITYCNTFQERELDEAVAVVFDGDENILNAAGLLQDVIKEIQQKIENKK